MNLRFDTQDCFARGGTDLRRHAGIVDALDDKEYMGSLVTLLQDGTDFVRNNSRNAWRKVGDGRIEMPDYSDRTVLEGVVNALIHRNYMEIGSGFKKILADYEGQVEFDETKKSSLMQIMMILY